MSFADAVSWEQKANAIVAQKSQVLFLFMGIVDI
jgi:hypothetical protein